MHHWAHESLRDCDPWGENETPWHREWKSRFPEACREICFTALDGEIHRADIRTPTGIFIEAQHSAISDAERSSREAFYKNLVWIVDGRGFRGNFDIYHLLPDPFSELASDIVWSKASRQLKGAARGIFFRLSEVVQDNPHATKASLGRGLHQMHGISEIEVDLNKAYSGHHQYDWIRPHRTWLDAKCPVYLDFGEEHLIRLETYDESGLKCIRLISKIKFVHDVNTETSATAIATRYYPLPTSARLNDS